MKLDALTGIMILGLVTLAYTWGGYPAMLAALARFRNLRIKKAEISPRLTVIVAARNEEQNIAHRLRNLCELDYPRECLEIIVASDGSTDGTADIVASSRQGGCACWNFMNPEVALPCTTMP